MTIINRASQTWDVPVRSVAVSPYELSPIAALGRLSADQPRRGALLRVVFADEVVGYADCHPWPELGDLPLSDQLACLRDLTIPDLLNGRTPEQFVSPVGSLGQGPLEQAEASPAWTSAEGAKVTLLASRSMEFARLDGKARARGRSLWEGLQIPVSHALVNNVQQLSGADLKSKAEQGFKHLKIKMGIHPRQEAKALVALAPAFHELALKLRLDFNAGLSAIEFEEFLETLGDVRDSVDYIEDPTVYDPRVWAQAQRRWGIRLALDRLSEETYRLLAPHSFSVLVVKPAIQKPEPLFQLAEKFRASLVVTSYLDHPIGQLCAARVAAQAALRPELVVEACGLLSHGAYEWNSFSEQLRTSGPVLLAPSGTGVGMDGALAELKWEQI